MKKGDKVSREFGSEPFFHHKISDAADDCRGGSDPLTLAWGGVIDAMRDVAWSISSVEAGDTGSPSLAIESVEALRKVRDALCRVEILTSYVVDVQRETVNGIIGGLAVVSDVSDDMVMVRLPFSAKKLIDDQPQRSALIRGAIDEAVRRKKGYGWTMASSQIGDGDFEAHHYTNDKSAWRVKSEVRAAILSGDLAAALSLLGEP